MAIITLIARIILGLIFFIFGLNGFFHFIPMPEVMPDKMMTFVHGMLAADYFFPLVSGTQVICGGLLLIGFFVPLALIVLAPVILNIILIHVFVSNDGLVLAVIIGALEVYLSFFARPYSAVVRQIFRSPKLEIKKK